MIHPVFSLSQRSPRAPDARAWGGNRRAQTRAATRLSAWAAAALLACFVGPRAAQAQASIALDDTLPGVTAGDLTGPDFVIDETHGSTVGNNQFHSFERFGLESGESATFDGPATTERFISRVTGGEVSRLRGPIRTTVDGADFYLLNPSGVVVGEGGALDVRGDVTFSTADEVVLGGGAGVFSATAPLSSVLSSTPVTSFGFLSASPAPIEIRNAQLESRFEDDNALLGHDLALIGGDIEIRGSGLANELTYLYSRGGQITLASVGGPGSVSITPGAGPGEQTEVAVSPGTTRGDIFIGDRAAVISGGPPPDVTFCVLSEGCQFANGSGDIRVFGDDLTLDGGELRAITVTNRDAGMIDVDLTGDLVMRGTTPTTPSLISALSGLQIGDEEGFLRFTQVFPFAEGELRVVTETSFPGNEVTRVTFPGTGNAGDIVVRAANISLSGLSEITSNATFGGDAGAITLSAPDGTIAIDATGRSGEFGSIVSNARDDSDVPAGGDGGAITITADTFRLDNDARVLSEVRNGGDGGDITIEVAHLRTTNDGRIDSSTRGSGSGGSIRITASEDVRFEGQIDPTTFPGVSTLSQPEATGDAGQIQITTPALRLRDGARITTTALGAGDAGTIDVRAASVELEGSRITAEANTGEGGDIYVNGGPVTVDPDGGLSVDRPPDVSPGGLLLLTDSEISTSVSDGLGGGGDLALAATSVVLVNSQILAEAVGGNGGNIRIEASSLVRDETSDINADSALAEDGREDFTSPEVVIRVERPDLPAQIQDATAFLRDACAARDGGAVASLVIQRHSGLAPAPAGPLALATPVPAATRTTPSVRDDAAPDAADETAFANAATTPLLVRVTCPG
ncbi:MAG: filamentous hemagglutinin N-terminal domain-containing protein [Myxococcota bacterium]